MKRIQAIFSFLLVLAIMMASGAMSLTSSAEETTDTAARDALLNWYNANVTESEQADDSNISYSLCATVGDVQFYSVGRTDTVFTPTEAYKRYENRIVVFPDNLLYAVLADGQAYSFTDAYDAKIITDEMLASADFSAGTLSSVQVGDVDMNGMLTVSDVVEMRSLIIAGTDDDTLLDIDGSGMLTVSDIVLLRDMIFKS